MYSQENNWNIKNNPIEKKHHVQQRLPSVPPVLSTLVFSEGTWWSCQRTRSSLRPDEMPATLLFGRIPIAGRRNGRSMVLAHHLLNLTLGYNRCSPTMPHYDWTLAPPSKKAAPRAPLRPGASQPESRTARDGAPGMALVRTKRCFQDPPSYSFCTPKRVALMYFIWATHLQQISDFSWEMVIRADWHGLLSYQSRGLVPPLRTSKDSETQTLSSRGGSI